MSFKLHSLVAIVLGTSVAAVSATDFVVVRSSASAFVKGAQFGAGEKIDLAPGQQLTVVSTGGEVTVLRGAAGGVTLPLLQAGESRASSAALAALVSQPAPRRSFGAMRGKDECPQAESLASLEAILAAAEVDACKMVAQQALERWVRTGESGQK